MSFTGSIFRTPKLSSIYLRSKENISELNCVNYRGEIMKLNGCKVVILGGSSGIGLATAKAAHDEGASLVIASRSQKKLEQARAKIGEGDRVETFAVDVTDEAAVRNMFYQLDQIDHLVVTAAQAVVGLIVETDSEILKPTLDSRIWGAFYAAKYAASKIVDGGSITFMSGLAGWKPSVGASIAASSGAAIEAFARTLALELAPIRVNTVCAGVIDTPMLDDFFGKQRQETVDEIAASLPLKRIGRPDDIAESILFLMNSGFTTGTVLHIDGGHLLV